MRRHSTDASFRGELSLVTSLFPSPPRIGGEGRGEEELNYWKTQIKSPSPRASLRGEGVNHGGCVKMRPKRSTARNFS